MYLQPHSYMREDVKYGVLRGSENGERVLWDKSEGLIIIEEPIYDLIY